MVRKVILCLSIIFFCFCRVMAQSADTLSQPDIYYSSPKTYEIAGIEVTGIGEQYDPETLILATGLRVGIRGENTGGCDNESDTPFVWPGIVFRCDDLCRPGRRTESIPDY